MSFFGGLQKQRCQVSSISLESHAFSVTSRFSACLSFISRISCCRLLHKILYGSDGILNSLLATLKLKMHKNALATGAVPLTPLGELNCSVFQTSG